MTVFMLVVAEIIPATSDVIPLVGIFFGASMVEMMVMIIVLCYIMRLHHKIASDPPMSPWMRRYVQVGKKTRIFRFVLFSVWSNTVLGALQQNFFS